MTIAANKPTPSITPNIFAPVKATGGMYSIKPYPQSAAIMEVLANLLEGWKITPYKLSRLLGMNSSSLPGKWMRGESKPSPYYCCLLLRLQQAVLFDKLQIVLVDWIDWDTGEIIYKTRDGDVRRRNIPGTLPANNSAMAIFHDKNWFIS